MSIPKIIHYCWFGNSKLNEAAIKCVESWKKYYPDYEIKKWDESNFDITSNKYVREAYEAKKYAFVSDYVRLFALNQYGGVYFDTDVELLKPIDKLMFYKGFIALEKGAPTPYGRKIFVNTGSGVGAEANNPFIKKMLDDYADISFIKENGRYDLTSCPERGTEALKELGFVPRNELQVIDDFAFLPVDFFSPFDFATGKTKITENTLGIHYYNNSWNELKKGDKLKRRLKCTKIGMLFMRVKYSGKSKLKEGR